jgi:hypothetical protein
VARPNVLQRTPHVHNAALSSLRPHREDESNNRHATDTGFRPDTNNPAPKHSQGQARVAEPGKPVAGVEARF